MCNRKLAPVDTVTEEMGADSAGGAPTPGATITRIRRAAASSR